MLTARDKMFKTDEEDSLPDHLPVNLTEEIASRAELRLYVEEHGRLVALVGEDPHDHDYVCWLWIDEVRQAYQAAATRQAVNGFGGGEHDSSPPGDYVGGAGAFDFYVDEHGTVWLAAGDDFHDREYVTVVGGSVLEAVRRAMEARES